MSPWLRILRPLNLMQASLAVVLTLVILGGISHVSTLLLLLLSVVFINGAGNIINDMYDLEIDRINRPDRPLPAGEITLPQARIFMILAFSIGVLFAGLINIRTLVIALVIATPLLIGYSIWFKRLPLIGNIVVSSLLGLTFIYVGAAVDRIEETLTMAGLAFGFTLIREIIKDLEDMDGDRRSDARTLPLVWGEKKTLILIVIMVLIFCVLDLLPYILGVYGEGFLWLVLVGVNIPLLLSAFSLMKWPSISTYTRIQLVLKLDIFVGLAAIYFGAEGI